MEVPMPIGVIFEFPGATSRAKYEQSVKLILKGRRKKLADWPVKGVLAHIAGRLARGRRLAIASGLQQIWQEAETDSERARNWGGEAKNLSAHQIHQMVDGRWSR